MRPGGLGAAWPSLFANTVSFRAAALFAFEHVADVTSLGLSQRHKSKTCVAGPSESKPRMGGFNDTRFCIPRLQCCWVLLGDLNAPELSETRSRTTARQLEGLVALVLGIIVAAVLAAVKTPTSDE